MALFNILVDIAARTASLESGMNAAVDSIKRLTAVAETAKSVLEKTFVGISFVGLVEGLAGTVRGIEEIGRAAEKASVTVEAFSALDFAAKQVGVSTEALSKGFKFMEKAIADAGDGVAKPRDALDALGVDLTKLQKLSPDKQFEVLAEAISRVKDPAQKMQVELALFGRAGNDLAPLFERGAAGIEELIEKAKEMGLVLDTEQTKKATEAAESMKSLHASWTAFTRTLATETAPTLTKITDLMRQMLGGSTNAEKIASLKAQLADMKPLMDTISQGGPEIQMAHAPEIQRWNEMTAALMKLEAASKSAAQETADNLAKIKDSLTAPAGANWLESALQWIKDLKAHLANEKIPTSRLDEFYQKLDEETQTAVEKAVREIDAFQAKLAELATKPGGISPDEAAARFREYLDKMLPDIEVKSKMIKDTVKDTVTFADQMMQSAAHSIQQSFANFLFDPFSKGVRGMVSGFVNAIRRMVAEIAANQILKNFFGFSGDKGGQGNTGFAGVLQNFLGGLFGGGSSAAPAGSSAETVGDAEQVLGVTGLAGGGPISGPSIVGEEGPELFIPGGSGTIVPNAQLGGTQLVHAPTYNINIDSRSDRVQVLHDVTTLLKHSQRDTVNIIMDAMNRNGYAPLRY